MVDGLPRSAPASAGTGPRMSIASSDGVERRHVRVVARRADAAPGMDDDRPGPEKPGQRDDDPAHDRDQPDELENDDAKYGLQIGMGEIGRRVAEISDEETEPSGR